MLDMLLSGVIFSGFWSPQRPGFPSPTSLGHLIYSQRDSHVGPSICVVHKTGSHICT